MTRAPGVLRVLTWNIQDHKGDPAAVRRVLRAADPDVVCLQEGWRWPGSASRLGLLARDCGLFHLCGGRRTAGTAVLAATRTVSHDPHEQRLPVRGLLTRPRGAASATVGLHGHPLVRVTSVHLGLTEDERRRHVGLLLDTVRGDVPTVFAGDLNEKPGGPSWVAFSTVLTDTGAGGAATFPAPAPRKRIDVVLASAHLSVVSCGWPAGVDEADVLAGSDHRPVLAELRLPAPV